MTSSLGEDLVMEFRKSDVRRSHFGGVNFVRVNIVDSV